MPANINIQSKSYIGQKEKIISYHKIEGNNFYLKY